MKLATAIASFAVTSRDFGMTAGVGLVFDLDVTLPNGASLESVIDPTLYVLMPDEPKAATPKTRRTPPAAPAEE